MLSIRHASRFSFAFAALALSAVACSSSSSSSTDSACDHYYAALFSNRCGGAPHSDARSAELKQRFHNVCVQALSEPGVGFGAGDVDACASAVDALDCNSLQGKMPDACTFKAGTLADGAGCLNSSQCASNNCAAPTGAATATASVHAASVDPAGLQPAAGTSNPAYCGTCKPSVADGQPCTDTDKCVQGDTCLAAQGSATGTCTKIVYGKAGDACDYEAKRCDTGLTCDPTTKQCAARKAAGEACELPSDCQADLTCAQGKCAAKGAAGADCTSSSQCQTPLGCDPSTKKCAAHPIAQPGQACDSFTVCDKGYCQMSAGTGGGAPTGTCPKVLADGAACTTTSQAETCDDFAECIDGKCQIPNAAVCK